MPAPPDPASVLSAADELAAPPDAVRTFVAALRTGVAVTAVALYVLLLAPPGMALALLFKWKGILYDLGHAGAWMGLKLAGVRYAVQGREHLTPGRAVVFCANHQSNVDPPLLFHVLHRRLHVLYKAELSKIPLLGRVLVIGGFVAVERENREAALASIGRGAESLQAGNSFLIFPEGTRSRTNALLPFKKGGFIMAIQAHVPVVPVAIEGGRAAMRRGSPLIWPAKVIVRVGKPIETAGLTLDDRDRLILQVRGAIQQMLDETRAASRP